MRACALNKIHTAKCNWTVLQLSIQKVLSYVFQMMIFDFIDFTWWRAGDGAGERVKIRICSRLFLDPPCPPLFAFSTTCFFFFPLQYALCTRKKEPQHNQKKPFGCIAEVVQMYLSFLFDRSHRTRNTFLGRTLPLLAGSLVFSLLFQLIASIVAQYNNNSMA